MHTTRRAAHGAPTGAVAPADAGDTPQAPDGGIRCRHAASGTRRTFLRAAPVLTLGSAWLGTARAAEFSYKLATGQDPTHPVNTRATEAAQRILEASGGRLDIKVFPANQLGSDTDLLSQVRSGGVQFFNLATSILATLVPTAGILNTGFAFPDYDAVWKAVDGDLGHFVRAQIGKAGLVTPSLCWDNGFRNVTSSDRAIRAPADLKGFKLRVPPAPMLTSLFKALDASPASINFSELYSALQTKVVEGQENPLAIIHTARLYEVQKLCSMTGHTWDGYWILGNRRAWERLPDDLRGIVTAELEKSGRQQRDDIARGNERIRADLTAKGMQFIDVDRTAFRDALAATSYYKDWKAKYGAEAWKHLETHSGTLA